MNTNMASARYALPFNSHSHFKHVHDQQIKQESDKSSATTAASPTVEPRESTGAKFTRKMQSMFPSKKEQRLARADGVETQEKEERKQGLMRRLMGEGMMVHSHRTHLGRP